jgi:dipeptidase E
MRGVDLPFALRRRCARMTTGRSPHRRVVLYSGGQERRNALIHEALLDLALRGPAGRRRGRVRMTYVPYTAEGAALYFRRFERRYRSFGGTHFRCVPADLPALATDGRMRQQAAREILASDVVYLAGGNTFYFLLHLRRSGLLAVLRRFARRGGVVAGLSAGAHLLTPHIGLAGHPRFDCDENEVGLPRRHFGAIGVVAFEFFPHYRHSGRYRAALAAYSRRSGRPVYACRDGSGVVVEGDRFTAHGDVWLFDRGLQRRIGD